MTGITRPGASWIQASWDIKALAEHLRCEVCAALATYLHRHEFLATGLCEFCFARLQPAPATAGRCLGPSGAKVPSCNPLRS